MERDEVERGMASLGRFPEETNAGKTGERKETGGEEGREGFEVEPPVAKGTERVQDDCKIRRLNLLKWRRKFW